MKTEWTLEKIHVFDEIIDVRAPIEYEADHIPGAQNFPVLNNDERITIGTLYRQKSRFEAKKQGAAMVASNVAHYLQQHFAMRDKDWQPLIYCWRGGSRSDVFAHVLRQIGWNATHLTGGYKTYRKLVIQTIEDLTPQLKFIVLCGRTGVGKSLLLSTLAKHGMQVLELETLANHRGSVLGTPIQGSQPTQKYFESLLVQKLLAFDPQKPVFVEAESRKIGRLQLPTILLMTMRGSHCIHIEANIEARIKFLITEYQHVLDDSKRLETALTVLIPFHGRKKIMSWLNWQQQGNTKKMIGELLNEHYDPVYLKSMQQHFTHYADSPAIHLNDIDAENMELAISEIVETINSSLTISPII